MFKSHDRLPDPIRIARTIRILMPAFAALCLLACQSKSDSARSKPEEIQKIHLPAPSTISESERMQLSGAVSSWYDSLLKKGIFNGGIVVAKGGNIIFEKYQGQARLESPDPITSNTPFHIASVSKTFTAMAVLKFCQDGTLSLDDAFSKYFPQFPYPGVTIQTLLNHRSGLPNYVYFMDELGWDKSRYLSNQDVLDYLVNRKAELKNIGTPNTRFTYCNTNYALLALLIEKLSGESYPVFMKKNYFDPIGMEHSFVFTKSDSARVPLSYDYRGRLIPLNYLDLVYGDKNIYSTPQDLLKWDRALKPGVIFRQEWLEKAYTPYSNEKPGIRNYGLGWRLNVYPDGQKLTYHNGWWHGNNASFVRMIQEDATIIVLGNKFTHAIYKTKYLCSSFNNKLLPDREEEDSNRVPGGATKK